jgi:hypothetical protein
LPSKYRLLREYYKNEGFSTAGEEKAPGANLTPGYFRQIERF